MKKSILATVLALVTALFCLVGCGQEKTQSGTDAATAVGGVLVLKVNPEIAVRYDEEGNVTAVEARNKDAKAIIDACEELVGQDAQAAIEKLITAIGEAGYFVEEVEGEARQIILEIEDGSKLPTDRFLKDIINLIKQKVKDNDWTTRVKVNNATDYDLTDYDTDYGPDSDGDTDFDDNSSDYNEKDKKDDDTDYGPNNDGDTDFDDTDFDDTDYGPNNDGVTDYDDSDYGPNNDGVTDFDDDTDYAPASTTAKPAPTTTPKPAPTTAKPAPPPAPTAADSDYDDSNYDNSDYDDSDYDD